MINKHLAQHDNEKTGKKKKKKSQFSQNHDNKKISIAPSNPSSSQDRKCGLTQSPSRQNTSEHVTKAAHSIPR
jgi:hypothetical protein